MSIQKKHKVLVWRHSVSAADDLFAPHEKILKVKDDETIETTLDKILATHYLPNIQGGKATWIVTGKNSLAVVAQQWLKPYFLMEATTPIKDLLDFTDERQIEFLYWRQVEPNEIIECIKQDKPLPDQHGRDKK
jgi:hypothetical protein